MRAPHVARHFARIATVIGATACGAAPAAAPATPATPTVEPARVEPTIAALVASPMTVRSERADEPELTLRAGGVIEHWRCFGRMSDDGAVDGDDAVVLVFDRTNGVIRDRGGADLFRLEGVRLTRADGRVVTIDADGRYVVEGGGGIDFRASGDTSTDEAKRTALFLFAFLTTCGG